MHIITNDENSLFFMDKLEELKPPKKGLLNRKNRLHFVHTYGDAISKVEIQKLKPLLDCLTCKNNHCLDHYQLLTKKYINLHPKNSSEQIDKAKEFLQLIEEISKRLANQTSTSTPNFSQLHSNSAPIHIKQGPSRASSSKSVSFNLDQESRDSYFNLLPDEIILQIFLNLRSKELAQCNLVSRRWPPIIRHIKKDKFMLFALHKVLKGKLVPQCSDLQSQVHEFIVRFLNVTNKTDQEEHIKYIIKNLKNEVLDIRLDIPVFPHLARQQIYDKFEEFLSLLIQDPSCPDTVINQLKELAKSGASLSSFEEFVTECCLTVEMQPSILNSKNNKISNKLNI